MKDKYPAYVSWETFEKVQAILRANRSDYLRVKGRRCRAIVKLVSPRLTVRAKLNYCVEAGYANTGINYGPGWGIGATTKVVELEADGPIAASSTAARIRRNGRSSTTGSPT